MGMFTGACLIILGTCIQAPSINHGMFLGGRFILGFSVSFLWWTPGFAHYRTSNTYDARYSIFPFRLLICILGMANVMLILLAAYRVPQLRNCIGADIVNLGGHLDQLLSCWMRFPGEAVSPSVEQGIHLIRLVEGIIQNEHNSSLSSRKPNQNSPHMSLNT